MSQQLQEQRQQEQQQTRLAYLVAAYFGTASVSLALFLRSTRPARERTWSASLQEAANLLNSVPDELGVYVLLNFFVSALALAAVFTATLFLGRLSVFESHRFYQRLFKCIMHKMVLVRTVITSDPRDVAAWLAWFAVVAYLRGFVGAAKDRLETLMSSPGTQPGRRVRGVSLLLLMMVYNAVAFAVVLRVMSGYSMARVLLCAFDCVVVAIEGLRILLRYAVNMADRYQSPGVTDLPVPAEATVDNAGVQPGGAATASAGGGWDLGWSGKGSILYHAELVADVLVHVVTIAHYLHVWVLHGLNFYLIDFVLFMEMRVVMGSLIRRLRAHMSYRAATKRLDTTFRDVRAGGGSKIADCTICMDEIVHVAKELPCGHVFHLSCLRAWLQQSGSENFTCPNCRKPILMEGSGVHGGRGTDPSGGFWRPDWWIVRMWERLVLRLAMLVEPLLLLLLINLTLWLGPHAQVRRRAPRPPPSPTREGFGESPGPSIATWGWGPNGGRRAGRANEVSSDPEHVRHDQEHEEISDDAMYDNLYEHADDSDDQVMEFGPGRALVFESSGEEEEDDGGRRRDADSEADVGRGDAAAAAWRGVMGAGYGCGGMERHCGMCPTPSRQAAAPRQRSIGGPEARMQPVESGSDLIGSLRHQEVVRRRSGSGGRQTAEDAEAAEGGDAEAGPSSAAAARRRRALRFPPLSAEVPSYSGDILIPKAAAVVRQISQTISASLRSSLAADGTCAGAVAWEVAEAGESEVSSRRRRQRFRSRPALDGSPPGGDLGRGDGQGNGGRWSGGGGAGGMSTEAAQTHRRGGRRVVWH